MASTYDVGTRAWQPDAAEGWVASELVNKTIDGSKAKLVFKLENGEVCTYSLSINSSCILTKADKNRRDRGRRLADWHRPFSASAHEPDHARSQRRFDKPITP